MTAAAAGEITVLGRIVVRRCVARRCVVAASVVVAGKIFAFVTAVPGLGSALATGYVAMLLTDDLVAAVLADPVARIGGHVVAVTNQRRTFDLTVPSASALGYRRLLALAVFPTQIVFDADEVVVGAGRDSVGVASRGRVLGLAAAAASASAHPQVVAGAVERHEGSNQHCREKQPNESNHIEEPPML